MAQYKLLLIDDEQGVLNSLVRVLRNSKSQILTALSAEEALPLVEKQKIDLIICDYKLKGINGLDFLENIYKDKPDTKTILLTGHADLDMAVDAINRGVIHKFILKPWDNKELINIVRQILEGSSQDALKKIKAESIMSKFAITVKDNATLLSAAHLMMRFKVSGLPVVSHQGGEVAGIITATDLFRVLGEFTKEGSDSKHPSQDGMLVEDVMTKEVCTAKKDTNLFDIIGIMYGKNIHTLPIMENKEIVGIIGRRDVINAFYNLFKKSNK